MQERTDIVKVGNEDKTFHFPVFFNVELDLSPFCCLGNVVKSVPRNTAYSFNTAWIAALF
jgi:hypothetical protein